MIRETELISLKDGKTKSLTEFVQDLAPTPEPMDLTPNTPVDTGGADPVALSSYIDGIADTSASDAISAGLASGGAIAQAIDNSILKIMITESITLADLTWAQSSAGKFYSEFTVGLSSDNDVIGVFIADWANFNASLVIQPFAPGNDNKIHLMTNSSSIENVRMSFIVLYK